MERMEKDDLEDDVAANESDCGIVLTDIDTTTLPTQHKIVNFLEVSSIGAMEEMSGQLQR